MTMVVAARFDEGLIVLADSRITFLDPRTGRPVDHHDVLQKILPFAPGVAMAFAGDVRFAARVLQHLQTRVNSSAEFRDIATAAPLIGREIRHLHEDIAHHGDPPQTGFLLAGFPVGTTDTARGQLFRFIPPDFTAEAIREFDVLGTGDVVRPFLAGGWTTIEGLDPPALTNRADWLIKHLEAELQKRGLLDVGGLFQAIVIDPSGIRPIKYGYLSVDPEDDADAFEMYMEKGWWYQRNNRSGSVVRLERPGSIVSLPGRVRDLLPAQREATTSGSAPTFLSHFIVCAEIERASDEVRFHGVVNQFMLPRVPGECQMKVSISVRVGTGTHGLSVELIDAEETTWEVICDEKVATSNPVEAVLLERSIEVFIPKEGTWFLEAWIDGKCIGRRSLVVCQQVPGFREALRAGGPSEILERQTAELDRRQMEGVDPILVRGERKAVLNYFVPCVEHVLARKMTMFRGVFVGMVSSYYPQNVRVMLGSSIRAAPGTHDVRVDLVDVVTKERLKVDSVARLVASSFVRDVSIVGEVTLPVPRSGVFALEQYVDDELSTRTIVVAENVEALRFLRLSEEDQASVRGGTILLL